MMGDWAVFAALSIAAVSFWGWWMLLYGVYDFDAGLRIAGSISCSWQPQLQALSRLSLPLIWVRTALLPPVWELLSKHRWRNIARQPVFLVYAAALVLPTTCVTALICQPGLGAVFDHAATLREWPSECAVDRPYHGLLQTRTWAFFTAQWMEVSMVVAVAGSWKKDTFAQLGAWVMTVPPILGSLAGPLDALIFNAAEGQDPCPDSGRLVAYQIIVAIANIAKLLLRLREPLMPALHAPQERLKSITDSTASSSSRLTVEERDSEATDLEATADSRAMALAAGGSPAGSDSGLANLSQQARIWLCVTVVEIVLLESLMSTAVETKAGPPLDGPCGSYKEFFLPRFRGIINWEYCTIAVVCLWYWGCERRNAHVRGTEAPFLSMRSSKVMPAGIAPSIAPAPVPVAA